MSTYRPAARHLVVLLVAGLVGLLALHGPTPSSATFTSLTRSLGQVSAAADWTPPTVSMTAPGPTVTGTTTLSVTAADAESGVASVVIERRGPGSESWATVCTDSTSPWSCAWDTTGLPDGEYALRARATDRVGLTTVSGEVRTTVVNRARVVLTAPGAHLRGTVTLNASVQDLGTVAHTVLVQRAPVGGTFTNLCTDLRSPYACTWNTTTVASGPHELRAVVLDSAGRTLATSPVVTVTVDNVAPAVTLGDPGNPLKGVTAFTATATDAHAGVRQVVVQYAATGSTTWTDLCSVTQQPWTCSAATGSLADGSYSFRAVATDAAGNSTTSAVVGPRFVENTPASVVATAAPTLTGMVQVGATAQSVAGVVQVKLQYAPEGTSTWTDLCTDTVAPWSCAWDTTTVANGLYQVRAVMVDGLGRTVTSAVVTGRSATNTLTGVDVQTFNGSGNTAGKAENGDSMTFTFSGHVNTASVLAGWNGTSQDVIVRLTDNGNIFVGTDEDVMDVTTPDGAVINLGSVNLKGDYVLGGRTAQFDSTMTATTSANPDGTLRTTITLRLGSLRAFHLTAPKTVTTNAAMVWTPSRTITDLMGRPCSPNPVIETGPLDREF